MDAMFLKQDGNLISMADEVFAQEVDLQQLMEDHPELLSGGLEDEPRQWLLIAREQGVPDRMDGPDRWSADHLFVDDAGVPTIVEVKRSSDTRIRREVVGQMLDYAANGVRFWPVERLQTDLADRAGGREEAATAVVRLLARTGQNLSVEEFWQRVEANLQAGRLRLVFVADTIPTSLRSIIEFLNEQMTQCEVLGIEIRRYQGGGQQVIAPTLIGRTSQSRRTKRQVDARSFDDQLADSTDAMREVTRRLDALATARGWQTTQSPSARQYRADGWTLLQLYPGMADGRVQLMLGTVAEHVSAQTSVELLRELEQIAGRTLSDRQPLCPAEGLLAHWERFTEEWLPRYVDAIRAAATTHR